MMQRIKRSSGLRIVALAAIFFALLLCFTLAASADEKTEVEISLDMLDFSGTGATVEGGVVCKDYDHSAALAALPVLKSQPALNGATIEVNTATFDSMNTSAEKLTVTFKVTGENAARYTVKNLVADAKIRPVYTVSFKDQFLLTDGKTPKMITVMGNGIPVEVLAKITYTVNGKEFTGTTELGEYRIVATLPTGDVSFLDESTGKPVTSMTATLTVKTDHILIDVEGEESRAILTADQYLSAGVSATVKKAEPSSKPSGTKNQQAYTISVKGIAGEAYTVIIPISAQLYGKDYDALEASNVYVYADGKPVAATEKGFKVTVATEKGYVKIEGLSSGEATFALAPAYHPDFLSTLPGILLLILLILILIILIVLIIRLASKPKEEKEEEPKEEEPKEEPQPAPVAAPVEEEPEEEEEPEPETDHDAIAAAVVAAIGDDEEEQDGIVFIDTKEHPDEYQEMLEKEAAGEGQVIYRYKRTFLSRLAQSEGSVQDYYNEIKNTLLSYKGVKSRLSAGYDAFNKGRSKIAKINPKVKTLYVYLAIDPASLQDSKYNAIDVSDKKKFESTPSLMKVRGERKFKYTLELIDQLCGEQLGCKKLEKEPEDFRVPFATTEELVESGAIRQFAGLAPLSYSASYAEPDEEPEEDVAADAEAADETTDTNA